MTGMDIGSYVATNPGSDSDTLLQSLDGQVCCLVSGFESLTDVSLRRFPTIQNLVPWSLLPTAGYVSTADSS